MATVAVVGSRLSAGRERDVKALMRPVLNDYFSRGFDDLVSGGARGVDTWAAEIWEGELGLYITTIRPDWDRYGKSAGFRRNVEIVEQADAVVAFWDGESKGTLHSINLALNMRKDLEVVFIEN